MKTYGTSKPSVLTLLWLSSGIGLAPMRHGITRVRQLDALWRALARGHCRGVLVDQRFNVDGIDGWEAALMIRERYTRLPVTVLTPRPQPRKGKKRTYDRKPL